MLAWVSLLTSHFIRTLGTSSMAGVAHHEGGPDAAQPEPAVELVTVDRAGRALRYLLPRSLALSMERQFRECGARIAWTIDAPSRTAAASWRSGRDWGNKKTASRRS